MKHASALMAPLLVLFIGCDGPQTPPVNSVQPDQPATGTPADKPATEKAKPELRYYAFKG